MTDEKKKLKLHYSFGRVFSGPYPSRNLITGNSIRPTYNNWTLDINSDAKLQNFIFIFCIIPLVIRRVY